jgi:hypothetical protein
MAYRRNIPLAPQSVSVWQRQERNNSFSRDDVMGVDHYPFSDPELGGKHRRLVLPEQAAPTTAADEMALFTEEDGGDRFISSRRASDGAVNRLLKEDTFQGKVPFGNLEIGAFCRFTRNGNILSGYNIASINEVISSAGGLTLAELTINFIDPMPNNNYFFDIAECNRPETTQAQLFGVEPNANYNDVVDPSFIILFKVATDVDFLQNRMNQLTVWVEP